MRRKSLVTSILHGAITQKNKWQIQKQQAQGKEYITVESSLKIKKDNAVLKYF